MRSFVLMCVWLVACDKDNAPTKNVTSETPREPSAEPAAEPSPPKASAIETTAEGTTKRSYDTDTYSVTVSAPPCKPKEPCTATLEVAAKAGYHVNKDYATKFLASASSGIAFKGKDKPDEFSKATGDFELPSETKGVMTVRYEGDGSAELVRVAGKYKLSVCSDATCQLAAPEIELPVPLQSGVRERRAL